MRIPTFLVALFLLSLFSPIVASDVTETQFKDGSTSYTHTFTGTGNGTAGVLAFPYGAEVTSASFDINGKPSTTTWGNLTNDSDFGGAGIDQWIGIPPGFAYGYKNNVEMSNNQVKLPGNPTNDMNTLSNSIDLTSSQHHNTTGAFSSTADHGFIGSSELNLRSRSL